jgi:hypothetical protein
MPNLAFPSVNEHECSWADIAVTFNVIGGQTIKLVDLEGIKWSAKVEVGSSSGTSGGRVMKRTAGSEAVEASATVTRSGMVQIIEGLEAAAVAANQIRGDQVIISGVSFDILVQHTPLGVDRIYTNKLVGCRYLGDSDDMKQGNEADVLELTLNPMQVLRKSSTGRWITLR